MAKKITPELIDTRDVIMDHLKKTAERDLSWLQKKTEIPYGTLYSCFVEKRFKISEENLTKINEVLGTNFE